MTISFQIYLTSSLISKSFSDKVYWGCRHIWLQRNIPGVLRRSEVSQISPQKSLVSICWIETLIPKLLDPPESLSWGGGLEIMMSTPPFDSWREKCSNQVLQQNNPGNNTDKKKGAGQIHKRTLRMTEGTIISNNYLP